MAFLATSLLLLLHLVAAADIGNFRGAILVKNGIPTSCELALIDNRAAFVAANCLDYTDGQVRTDIQYEVYFDGSSQGATGRATINAGDIHVNSFYNAQTFANNVAVVQFDFSAHGVWTNYFAVNRLEWTNVVYVRRLIDAGSMAWSKPEVVSQSGSDPGCARASGLFDSNQNDMLCSRHSVRSPVSARCSLPYGSLYGQTNRAMAVSALYSHTVVYGNRICAGGDTYNYYTLLSNYTRFAMAVLGRRPAEYIENVDQYMTLRHITNHRMASPGAPNVIGTTVFGGDLYAQQRAQVPPTNITTTPISRFSAPTTATGTFTDDNASSESASTTFSRQPATLAGFSHGEGGGTGGITRVDGNDDSSKSSPSSASAEREKTGLATSDGFRGLSRSTAIALAVTVPLLVIMASTGIYFMCKSRRKRRFLILQ